MPDLMSSQDTTFSTCSVERIVGKVSDRVSQPGLTSKLRSPPPVRHTLRARRGL
jgi:hypothetical protein